MDWKDTIIDDDTIVCYSVKSSATRGNVGITAEVFKNQCVSNISRQAVYANIDKLLNAQAEISIKAGRQEVVDWMASCMLREHVDTKERDVFCRDYRVYNGEWRAQKKKWGIK